MQAACGFMAGMMHDPPQKCKRETHGIHRTLAYS
jgi:hypothetical protein